MTKELLQQALDEAKADAIYVFTYAEGISAASKDAIEYMHSWLTVYFDKQALAQQEPLTADQHFDLLDAALLFAGKLNTVLDRDTKLIKAQQEHFEEQPDGTVIPVDPSEMAQQEPLGPATPEDMKIYKDIADGYRRDVAQQEQRSDSEYARGFADGQKEFAEIAGGAWQTAVIDQLVIHHIYQAIHDTDPRKAVHDLLCISNDIALDPQVSSDAQALVDRGRGEVKQEQPAQEPVSTDDMASAYLEKHLWKVIDMAGMWPKAKIDTRTWQHAMVYAPTQPALSESQITSIAYNCNALPEVITDKTLVDFVRAIEAHCRGGQA